MPQKIVNIAEALDNLELILGKDWLEENLKVIKDGQFGQGGFGRSIDFSALGIAYIAELWYKGRDEAISIEIAGGGLPGRYALTAAAIASELEVVKDCVGWQAKLSELKDAQCSLKTVHELGIAAGYAQAGQVVDFTRPLVRDWLPPCAAGLFMSHGQDKFTMVVCVEIKTLAKGEPGNVAARLHSALEQLLNAQGLAKSGGDVIQCQPTVYIYVGDIIGETEALLQYWSNHPDIKQLARDTAATVLVYTTGTILTKYELAYVRRGSLVAYNQALQDKGIYIPDEIMTPCQKR
ncbi:hypothetical protein [Sporotomaculum syntrophicum]|uniref:hypothetical protein n=1 Tax=Sporotomaculum syntrophicum TaxID=182264 RepID=UPI00137AB3B8|nr:hypothetical protein [Sporotomaculum syntrophicum]